MTQNFTNNYFKLFPSHYKNLAAAPHLTSWTCCDDNKRPADDVQSDNFSNAPRIAILPEEVLQLAERKSVEQQTGRAWGEGRMIDPPKVLWFFPSTLLWSDSSISGSGWQPLFHFYIIHPESPHTLKPRLGWKFSRVRNSTAAAASEGASVGRSVSGGVDCVITAAAGAATAASGTRSFSHS